MGLSPPSIPPPPPPEHPVLPPPARVPSEVPLVVESDAGRLEVLAHLPADARRLVVLAHPHPLYGGTMHNAVVVALARALAARGCAVARLNFRGVGASEGRFDGGPGETRDLIAVAEAALRRVPHARLSLAGYSFGAWVTLRAAPALPVDRLLFVAPAASLFDFASVPRAAVAAKIGVVVGDRDVFCSLGRARALAAHFDATLAVLAGVDHYFVTERRRIAARVVPFLSGESDALALDSALDSTPDVEDPSPRTSRAKAGQEPAR
jgi:hypothetical protein